MRWLIAVLSAGALTLAPEGAQAAPVSIEAFEAWAEAVRAQGPQLGAFLGLQLPSEEPPAQPALRGREARARPVVPRNYSAHLTSYNANMMGINYTDGVGKFYYDRVGQRMRATYEVTSDYFRPNATQVQDVLTANVTRGASARNLTFGDGKDGACVVFGNMFGYSDMFAWLQFAEYTGSKNSSDGPCDIWTQKMNQSALLQGFTEACFGADGVAREFRQVFTGRKFNVFQSFTYSNVQVGELPPDAFTPTYACASNYPAAPCEGTGVATVDLYRIFGPPEPVELRNRNAGDDLGDLSFACTQASGYRTKQITWWQVEVDTSFGEYSLCNFNGTYNNCVGGAVDHVGRRSSQMSGMGPVLGQCSANDDVGSQYSFPEDAQCPDGVHPGAAAGCAWGFARAIRTIEADCVMGHRGLMEACAEEMGHAPFRKAQRIWRVAFESDDPAQGGCPDAPPSLAQLVV